MKKIYLFLFLVGIHLSYAQIPTGYYSTATGTGFTLKTQLYNKIKGHSDKGYAGLWTTYSTSDRDKQYENDNTVIDMYSENPTTTDPYTFLITTSQCGTYSTEGNCYNREHIVPQSVFNSAAPLVSDAHFIPPTDGKVNGMRSNFPHGTVAVASWTSLNGSKLGTSSVSGYTGTVFEPINEFKGDIARMYFYFATRYENTVATYAYPMFNGTSNQVFTPSFLNMLLTWHNQDPVSAREIARNNAVYARQLNRNPFIDHPEYVQLIWGGTIPPVTTPDTIAPSSPTNLAATAITATSLQLNWTAATDNTAVTAYEVYQNGLLKATVTTTTISITGLTAATAYTFYVKAKDAAGNASVNSTTVSATTASTSLVTDLYFSEYIEGSSNNKVLEITNATGNAVSLSGYVVKKQTNGAGAWSTGIALTGTLVNNGKFVLVNSSILSTCYATSNASIATTATELAFNGNDAIGLFKNGVLLDIIGVFNGGTANFSVDETIRRKTTVVVPKSTFNKTTDWTVFALDTCSGIGNKFSSSEESSVNAIDFNVFPNPSNGNVSITVNPEITNFKLSIYSIYGQKIMDKSFNTNESIVLDQVQKGIYLITIDSGELQQTKKLVIN